MNHQHQHQSRRLPQYRLAAANNNNNGGGDGRDPRKAFLSRSAATPTATNAHPWNEAWDPFLVSNTIGNSSSSSSNGGHGNGNGNGGPRQQQQQQQQQHRPDSPEGDSIFSDEWNNTNFESSPIDMNNDGRPGNNGNDPLFGGDDDGWTSFRSVDRYRSTSTSTPAVSKAAVGNAHKVVDWPSSPNSPTPPPPEPAVGAPVTVNASTANTKSSVLHNANSINKASPTTSSCSSNHSPSKVQRARGIIQQRNQRRLAAAAASVTSAAARVAAHQNIVASAAAPAPAVTRHRVNNQTPSRQRQQQRRRQQKKRIDPVPSFASASTLPIINNGMKHPPMHLLPPARGNDVPLEPEEASTAAAPLKNDWKRAKNVSSVVPKPNQIFDATPEAVDPPAAQSPPKQPNNSSWKDAKAKQNSSFDKWVIVQTQNQEHQQLALLQKKKKSQWGGGGGCNDEGGASIAASSVLTDEMNDEQLMTRRHHRRNGLPGGGGNNEEEEGNYNKPPTTKPVAVAPRQQLAPVQEKRLPMQLKPSVVVQQRSMRPPAIPSAVKQHQQPQQQQQQHQQHQEERANVSATRSDSNNTPPPLSKRSSNNINKNNNKPPLYSPAKVPMTTTTNTASNTNNNSRIHSSVRARRMLWGGHLPHYDKQQQQQQQQQQGKALYDSTDYEEKQHEYYDNPDELVVVLDQQQHSPHVNHQKVEDGPSMDEADVGGFSMVKLVESAIQEATWKNGSRSSLNDQSSSSASSSRRGWPPVADSGGSQLDTAAASTNSNVRWPPTHPDSRPSGNTTATAAATTASPNAASTSNHVATMRNRSIMASSSSSSSSNKESSSASNNIDPSPTSVIIATTDHHHSSPTQQQQRRFVQGQQDSFPGQSPTRSDHSADAAAGMFGGSRHQQSSLVDVRRRIFGPLGDNNNADGNDNSMATVDDSGNHSKVQNDAAAKTKARIEDEMKNLASSANLREKQIMSLREIMRDDESLDDTGSRVQPIFYHHSNGNANNASRSIHRAKPTSAAADPVNSMNSIVSSSGNGGSFDQSITRKVSWENNESPPSIDGPVPASKNKLNTLEDKLSKLLQHQPMTIGGGGRSHTFDSATNRSSAVSNRSGNRSGAMTPSGGGSVVSIQPSVESECVRQNAQIALEMEGAMMEFFMSSNDDEDIVNDNDHVVKDSFNGEEEGMFHIVDNDHQGGWSDEYEDEVAGPSHTSPGSCCGGLEPLAEEETAASSPRCHEIPNEEEDGYQYHYQEQDPKTRIQYTSLQQLDDGFRVVSPDEDTMCPTATTVRLLSNSYPLMPVVSKDYDDPSLFDNSLMSDDSSELTPLGVQPSPPWQPRRASPPAAKNHLALQIANKNADLTKFLDQFSDHILRGCDAHGDNDSSDVFFINNSQFGPDISQFSQLSNGSAGPDIAFGNDPFENSQFVHFGNNNSNSQLGSSQNSSQHDDKASSPSMSNPATLSRTGSLPKKPTSSLLEQEEDSVFEEDEQHEHQLQQQHQLHDDFGSNPSNTTNLPPASTFLSAKERARIRQHDTTPLRTNTTRARGGRRTPSYMSAFSYGETSMSSIKEGMEDEDNDTRESSHEENGSNESNESRSSGVSSSSSSSEEPSATVIATDTRSKDGPSNDGGGSDSTAADQESSSIDGSNNGSANSSSASSSQRSNKKMKEEPDMIASPPSKIRRQVLLEPSDSNKEDPPSSNDGLLDTDFNDNNSSNKDDKENDPSIMDASDHIKMTYRERSRKGSSLAWHTSNGVNEDSLYDSKHYESRSARAATLAGRLNLLSISSHTATFRQHFGDDTNKDGKRQRVSSLYHPSYTNGMGFIQEEESSEEQLDDAVVSTSCSSGDEESHSPSDEDEEEDDDDVPHNENDDDSYAESGYTHDEFVRDFKDMLSKDKKKGLLVAAATRERVHDDEVEVRGPEEESPDSSEIIPSADGSRSNISSSSNSSRDISDESSRFSELKPRRLAPVMPPSRKEQKVAPSNNVPIPKKSNPASSNLPPPIRFQMHEHHDPMPTMAQRRALFMKDRHGGGSSRVAVPPTRQQQTSSHSKPPIATTAKGPSRNQPPSRQQSKSSSNVICKHSHPHHVPVEEPTKSLLEKKLLGISTASGMVHNKMNSANNSVGTSELGSLLTKCSDRSYAIGLPVPSMVFHRTHPRSPRGQDNPYGGCDDDCSARSSPSSMQNTYNVSMFNTSSGIATAANNCATTTTTNAMENNGKVSCSPRTPSDVDGCQAVTNDIASQVKILLPDDDDDESQENTLLLNCPTPPPPPPPATTDPEVDYSAAVDDIANKIDQDLRRTNTNSRQQRGTPPVFAAVENNTAYVAIQKSSSRSVRENYSVGNVRIQEVRAAYSSRIPKRQQGVAASAGKQPDLGIIMSLGTGTWKTSNHAAVADDDNLYPYHKQRENSIKNNMRSNTYAPYSAPMKANEEQQRQQRSHVDVHKVKNFWNQLDNDNNKSRSASSSPEVASSYNPIKQHASVTLAKSNSTQHQQQQRQIPSSFNRKNLHARKNSRTTEESSTGVSHHSSIFEAFEVAPLQTTISSSNRGGSNNDAGSSGNVHVSLNDFGVHHAYVKRGGYKQKVGFPETAPAKIPSRHRKQRPPPPPPPQLVEMVRADLDRRPADASSSGTNNGVGVSAKSSSQDDEFEVMLQTRNLSSSKLRSNNNNNKRPSVPPSSSTVGNRKQVPIGASSGKTRQPQQQQAGVKKNSNSGGISDNKGSSHQEKIKRRIQFGWKKMVMSGVPRSGNNGASLTSTTNRHAVGAAGVPKNDKSKQNNSTDKKQQPLSSSSAVVGSKALAARGTTVNNKSSSSNHRSRMATGSSKGVSGSNSGNSRSWVARTDANGNVEFTQR